MSLPKLSKKILFFIAAMIPTPEEIAQAKAIGTGMFRNASQVLPGDNVEKCDAVAGLIPEQYSHLPVATPEGIPEPTEAQPNDEETAPIVATTETPGETLPLIEKTQREKDDEGAHNATSAQLRQALDILGIPYKAATPKAELLALYLNRP